MADMESHLLLEEGPTSSLSYNSQGESQELLSQQGSQLSDEMKERIYKDLCVTLNMDSATRELGWADFLTLEQENPEKFGRIFDQTELIQWYVCILFFAGRLGGPTTATSSSMSFAESKVARPSNFVSISHLLRPTKMTMMDFFERITLIIQLRDSMEGLPPIPSGLRDAVLLLKRRFCILAVMFYKFESVFQDVFLPSSLEVHFKSSDVKSYIWTLFLVAKEKCFPEATMSLLLEPYYLLIVCLNYVASQIPSAILAPEYSFLSMPAGVVDEDSFRRESLFTMCGMLELHAEELEVVRRSVFTPFLIDLIDKHRDCVNFDNGVPPLRAIDGEYEKIYMEQCAFDERLWLVNDVQISTPAKHRPRNLMKAPRVDTMHHRFRKATFGSLTEGTPVRDALKVKDELYFLLKSCPEEADAMLKAHFEACDSSLLQRIADELSEAKERFVDKFGAQYGASSSGMGAARFSLAVKLFYRLFSTILVSEAKRLNKSSFSGILKNADFRRSLMACSLEIILVSSSVLWNEECELSSADSLKFPFVLSLFKVSAFEFIKVIESVVTHEQKISSHTRKYLGEVEQKVIRQLAWEKGSPLHTLINRHGVPTSLESERRDFKSVVIMHTTPLTSVHLPTSTDSISVSSLSPSKKNLHASMPPAPSSFAVPVSTSNVAANMLLSLSQPSPTLPLPSISSSSSSSSISQTQSLSLSPRKVSQPLPSPSPRSASLGMHRFGSDLSVRSLGGDDMDDETLGLGVPSTPSQDALYSPRSGQQKSRALIFFFRKLYHFSRQRLSALCSSIKSISEPLKALMWMTFENCVTQHPALLVDRHIDQLLLCSVYAICKLKEIRLDFKSLVAHYKELAGHELGKPVYRRVLLTKNAKEEPHYGTIISFYNDIFVPEMKDFISSSALQVPDSAKKRIIASKFGSPLKHVRLSSIGPMSFNKVLFADEKGEDTTENTELKNTSLKRSLDFDVKNSEPKHRKQDGGMKVRDLSLPNEEDMLSIDSQLSSSQYNN